MPSGTFLPSPAAPAPVASEVRPAKAADSAIPWHYLYGRNSLDQSALIGRWLVATTEAGHILAFDTKPFALVQEKLSVSGAKCLGAATDRDVVVGFRDGVIGRMSVPALSVQQVARVPGRPVWIGQLRRSQELVVVYAKSVDRPSAHYERLADYSVKYLPGGREVRVKESTAYFLDDQDRLWLGADHGEWGGGVQVVEAGSDRVKEVELPKRYDTDNVYGFLQVGRDVWAFGGLNHFGTSAFVARLSETGPAVLLHHAEHFSIRDPPNRRRFPNTPIAHIAKQGNRLLVVAASDVFETDATLKRWKRRYQLDLRYVPGRPDAVGNYPSARTLHVLGDRLFAATRRNGYVELGPDGVVPRALPHQLPVAPAAVFTATDEIVVAGYGEDWVVLGPEGDWFSARSRLLPAVPPAPERDETPTWCNMRFFPTADGALRIVAQSGLGDGFGCMSSNAEETIIEGVRRDRRFIEQTRVSSRSVLDQLFELPDGRLAMTDPEYALWAFEAGTFRKIADNWVWQVDDRIGAYGDGWLVQTHGGLALLRNTPQGKPLFTELAVSIEGIQPGISDAVPAGKKTLLATSTRGLLSYDVPSGVATLLHPKGLTGDATWIGIDARGRIWLAGDGVYLFLSPNRVLPIADIVPFLAGVTVKSVALTGNRLILALGSRGLLLLDTDEVAKLARRGRNQ